jgi:hypothetical protein
MNTAGTQQLTDRSPGSQESGLLHFWDRARGAQRTPKAFMARILSPAELDRIQSLLRGPRHFIVADKRLLGLGLARVALGKTVATKVAWESIWRQHYELRRGSDLRQFSVVSRFETDGSREALAHAWSLARRHVGPKWQDRLLQEGSDGHWTIFLQPPRAWPKWQVRPYVLELRQIRP